MSNNNDTAAEVVFEYTGEGCSVPKDVTIVLFHPSVIEVEDEAFRNCNNLREVVFNDGLQKIGTTAFWGCRSLSSIAFPSTLTEIGEGAFRYCNNLREVTFNDGLQKIGASAFWYCTSLSTITLPSAVTEIDGHAFCGCGNIRVVVLNEGLQKIGRNAFYGCDVSTITIPSTVTEIGDYAFGNCYNLTEGVLNEGIQKIGQATFSNYRLLERFTLSTISTRLDALIQTGHWDEINNRVDTARGVVERSDDGLFVTAAAMGGGRNWNQVRESLDRIIALLSYYEIKEGTSIFELALWKFKLDQVDEANPIPRKKCRMDVPGPVKDIILQYLS